MTAKRFVDTNILIYAYDLAAGRKHDVAFELMRAAISDGSLVLSTQVLGEYFTVLTRKLKVAPSMAVDNVRQLASGQVVGTSREMVLAAVEMTLEHSISYWDAMIVAAAQHAQCPILYSEDLQAGRTFGTTQIVNPFA